MLMARSCSGQRMTVRSCVLPAPGASQGRSPISIRDRRATDGRSSCPMAATFSSLQMAPRQRQESISDRWMAVHAKRLMASAVAAAYLEPNRGVRAARSAGGATPGRRARRTHR